MPKRTITLNDGSRCAEEVISYKMLFIEVSSHGKQLVNKSIVSKRRQQLRLRGIFIQNDGLSIKH